MNKIVLTGASSFLGFHIAHKLSEKNNVICFLSKSFELYDGIRKERLELLRDKVSFVVQDIINHSELKDRIVEIAPDFFVHHAGYTDKYTSFDYDFEKSLEINVKPISVIVKALTEVKAKGWLVTGTCMEYSDSDAPHQESEDCNPSTPYGKSKLNETLEAISKSKEAHLPLRVLRIFNPFGDMENPNKLFPYTLGNLVKNEEVKLSPCTQVRSFTHAEQVRDFYDFMVKNLSNGGQEIFNVVFDEGTPLKSLLLNLCHYMNKDEALLSFGERAMSSTESLVCTGSTQKIFASGYRSKLSTDEQLKKWLQETMYLKREE